MAQRVVHYPRLAWDGALIVVRVLESDRLFGWFSEEFGLLTGPAGRGALVDSWNRLWLAERLDAPQVEAGRWRVRLEELLYARPEVSAPFQQLVGEAAARLARTP
jgi:hypothetical protein